MAVSLKKLDVRPLIAKGIEPLATIRTSVDSLKKDERLTVMAPFLPSPLIEKLRSEGFRCEASHEPGGAWAVTFWRSD